MERKTFQRTQFRLDRIKPNCNPGIFADRAVVMFTWSISWRLLNSGERRRWAMDDSGVAAMLLCLRTTTWLCVRQDIETVLDALYEDLPYLFGMLRIFSRCIIHIHGVLSMLGNGNTCAIAIHRELCDVVTRHPLISWPKQSLEALACFFLTCSGKRGSDAIFSRCD